MGTLASAMRRENHRRSKAPSSALASGTVPLVMTFLSCLAWLYVAGRYVPPLPAQNPDTPIQHLDGES